MRVEENDPLAEKFPKRKVYWYKPKSVLIEPLHYPGCRGELGDVPIPATRLRGLWMEACGVRVGDRMAVELGPGYITLRLRDGTQTVKTDVVVKKVVRAALLAGFVLRSCLKAFRRGLSGKSAPAHPA
jgi:toxic protein SymE